MRHGGRVGPEREQIEPPEGLDRRTVGWFLEEYGRLATEIGIDEILTQAHEPLAKADADQFEARSLTRSR
jgi:ribosome biogenesis SPOUT family RNA methylase Rps3